MREIKFRAWDTKGKQMVEHEEMIMDCDGFRAIDEEGDEFPMDVIMQFTGLTDKNGKEIYEGDIVKVCFATGKENCEIVEEKGCYWISQKITGYIRDMAHDNLYWHIDGCEVIGNIYENPELLNK